MRKEMASVEGIESFLAAQAEIYASIIERMYGLPDPRSNAVQFIAQVENPRSFNESSAEPITISRMMFKRAEYVVGSNVVLFWIKA